MTSLRAAGAALVLVITILAAALQARPPAAGTAETGEAIDPIDLVGAAGRVDDLFARWNTKTTPGCAVAVEQDGRRLLSRAYGMADLEHGVPNTVDTVFEAGSVSKQLTAAAALVLARQGRLSLDDDVREHVPEVPDYGTPITLRHLMHQTSGLRDWGVVTDLEGWPRGLRVHTMAHVLEVVARQRALNFPTGSEHSYSNTNYNLLAIAVERASGQRFAAFTRRALFEPLGMTQTRWRDDHTRVVPGRAVAYGSADDGYHSRMPLENVVGDGGLLTTVGDLLRWNRGLERREAGGPGVAEELERPGRLSSGVETDYAGGLYVTTHCGVREVSHAGWAGAYQAFLGRYPQQKLSVAVLCNTEAEAETLARQVADLYLPAGLCDQAAASFPAAVPVPAAELAAKTGLYRSRRTGMPVRLVSRGDRLATEEGEELVPLSRTTFDIRPGGTRVEFDPGPDGRAAVMRITHRNGNTSTFDRVADVSPTAGELASYAGEFASDEVLASYTVAVEHGDLVLRRRPSFSARLEPAYADAFLLPGGLVKLVRFFRGADGKVKEMSIGSPRGRDIRFQRVARLRAVGMEALPVGMATTRRTWGVEPPRPGPLGRRDSPQDDGRGSCLSV